MGGVHNPVFNTPPPFFKSDPGKNPTIRQLNLKFTVKMLRTKETEPVLDLYHNDLITRILDEVRTVWESRTSHVAKQHIKIK